MPLRHPHAAAADPADPADPAAAAAAAAHGNERRSYSKLHRPVSANVSHLSQQMAALGRRAVPMIHWFEFSRFNANRIAMEFHGISIGNDGDGMRYDANKVRTELTNECYHSKPQSELIHF